MLDFRISLIDRIRGLSFGFGFKNVGLSQGCGCGFSSDVGFWFFFRILIHSFLRLGFSGPGFESLIDHTNNTNIQIRSSQRKRIIALFLCCRFYGPDRRNTHPATCFSAIFLEPE
jgi:hypothetical protein